MPITLLAGLLFSPITAGISFLLAIPLALYNERLMEGYYQQAAEDKLDKYGDSINEALAIVQAYPRETTIDDVDIDSWVKLFKAREVLSHHTVLY